jgi:hypothetical protein
MTEMVIYYSELLLLVSMGKERLGPVRMGNSIVQFYFFVHRFVLTRPFKVFPQTDRPTNR